MTGLAAFAFGKLPAHGDFVARGLSAAERDAWDAWASEGLASVREALGDAEFEARHDVAPPWRFAFGSGPFGPGWRAGALTPSVDRTGRRYLVLAGVRSDAPLDPDAAGGRIAEAAEEAIYGVFASGGDIDALTAAVQAAVDDLGLGAQDPATPDAPQARFWTAEAAQSIVAPQPPADLLARVLATA